MRLSRRSLLAITAAAVSLPLRAGLAQTAPALITKPIPSSGERLPVIGIGTARRYQQMPDEAGMAVLQQTLRSFAAAGGKLIDTAPSYGEAETLVGTLVDSLGNRGALFLATKVGANDRDAGLAQIERSFKRLRTPKIDLICVHNLRDTAAQLQSLRELKQAGRIRYLGITTSFDNQYAEFEATMRREPLDFIQIDYALDNRGAAERILPLARDRGMGVMINLPFGRGSVFRAVQGKALPDWATEIDCRSWAQFFLKYLVSHEAVTCAIPGTATPQYAADNIGAATGRLPDAAMRRRMEALVDAV